MRCGPGNVENLPLCRPHAAADTRGRRGHRFNEDHTRTVEGRDGLGSWRFPRTCAGKICHVGSIVRTRTADCDNPTWFVRRHKRSWGWILESPWALQTSFPLARRGAAPLDAELADGAVPSPLPDQDLELRMVNETLKRRNE